MQSMSFAYSLGDFFISKELVTLSYLVSRAATWSGAGFVRFLSHLAEFGAMGHAAPSSRFYLLPAFPAQLLTVPQSANTGH